MSSAFVKRAGAVGLFLVLALLAIPPIGWICAWIFFGIIRIFQNHESHFLPSLEEAKFLLLALAIATGYVSAFIYSNKIKVKELTLQIDLPHQVPIFIGIVCGLSVEISSFQSPMKWFFLGFFELPLVAILYWTFGRRKGLL
jgi:hypothetical protein